ncbi:DEKNAAC102340 [Brettanomyces naardenensis]|uniref:NADPH--cytochrome P450 reductase n=1 Tax=Brettanomyces naardenensis TaxID=13370 RepID=A0A448YK57_BRENA|nr:DEKNAAC102340 [Brettanomyces naardenensis]
MAIDTLDLAILVAIIAAVVAYFTRGKLWDKNEEDVSATGGSGSRDLMQTLKETGKKALVLFGSQTGTAEDYAHKFAKEFQARFGIPTMCGDLADYDYDSLDKIVADVSGFRLVVFFNATYGEGEPTDNAIDFFDYLDNECEDLSGLKFACFGLGNSTYEFYNAAGKKVADILKSKNAELVGELGLGDDGRGTMDEDYLSWKDSLFEVIKGALSLDEKEAEYEASIEVTEVANLTKDSPTVSLGEPDAKYVSLQGEAGPFDHTHPFLAPVLKTKDLSPNRHCIHAELDLSGSNMKYLTGDHLAIWPSNPDSKVSKMLSALGLQDRKDAVIKIKLLDPTVHSMIPSPTTYGAVIRHYLEISGPVSRQFIGSIVQFAPDEETKQRAKEIAEDKVLFQKRIIDQGFNIADALLALSNGSEWSTVPFAFIIESIPHIQPRYYSISSSALSDRNTVHVTVMVEANEVAGTDRLTTGVASNLLFDIELAQNKIADIEPFENYNLEGPRGKFHNYRLPVHVRRSTFKLPSNPNTPIIMVGPGTGVAPFRGFIREKVRQVENGEKSTGEIVLFYGCRKSTEDFLYKEEWPEYSKKLGDRFKFITAFSREADKKVYVQHKMLEHKKELADLLDKGAFFYVCGDASKMARDVQKALIKVVAQEKKVPEDDAAEMVKQLKIQNRYQEDVW